MSRGMHAFAGLTSNSRNILYAFLPMDTTSSPQKIENSSAERRRASEDISVLSEQIKAIERLKGVPVRHFRLESVMIDTVSGEPLTAKMWVTEDEPPRPLKKEKERFECEFCHKVFDKRHKMLLHARFHNK